MSRLDGVRTERATQTTMCVPSRRACVRPSRQGINIVTKVKTSQPLATEQGCASEPYNERQTIKLG
jgi:hypothetical protein